jgi:hypothetical protein
MNFEEQLGALNESYFFREFTFSTNKFSASKKTELELADKIVWLEDFVMVFQVKERFAALPTAETEEGWFLKEILGKAVGQVENTLTYLHKYDSIELTNNKGHAFNLAEVKTKHIHKLVLYYSNELLPPQYRSRRFHMSDVAGVVHLMRSDDYFLVVRALITPVEVEEYLNFRAELVRKWGASVNSVDETALLGHFLRNLPDSPPSPDFTEWFLKLAEKSTASDKWDISRIIHLFDDRRNTPQSDPTDYYGILKELARLNRIHMDKFKERFSRSLEMTETDTPALPYRFVASTGCGFLFIPLLKDLAVDRVNLLHNLTALNKYDLQLDRCVGATFLSGGTEKWWDIQWTRIEYPWVSNPTYEAKLAKFYPFRPLKIGVEDRYKLDGDWESRSS